MGLGKLFAANAVKEGAAAVVLWDANEVALKETAAELEDSRRRHSPPDRRRQLTGRGGRAAERVQADLRHHPRAVQQRRHRPRQRLRFWESRPATSCSPWRSTRSARCWSPGSSCGHDRLRQRLPARQHRVVGRTERHPRMAACAASEWAAVGFSDSLRLELGAGRTPPGEGRSPPCAPAYINTGMFDGAKGILSPDARAAGRRRPHLDGDAG